MSSIKPCVLSAATVKERPIKSTTFHLTTPCHYPDYLESGPAKYRVPTLPAYAIEYADLWLPTDVDGQGPIHEIVYPGQGIEDDTIYWSNPHHVFNWRPEIVLVVHYHGIRSYSALFPTVDNGDRRKRLGEFYWESEVAFDSGAWLSFILMCGAIFEGLLIECACEKGDGFHKAITKAEKAGVLRGEERCIVNSVRELRNRVHLRRACEPQVSRTNALDARVVLDRVIRSVSEQIVGIRSQSDNPEQ